MGIETAFILSTVATAASGFMQYRQQKAADKAAKRAYADSVRIAEEQAELDRQDAERAAELEVEEAERARSLQKVLFLSSGVTLDDSPLLVMEETRRKGQENAQNIRESRSARANLAVQRTKAQRPVSRANLFGTVADTVSTAGNNFAQYQVMKKQLG